MPGVTAECMSTLMQVQLQQQQQAQQAASMQMPDWLTQPPKASDNSGDQMEGGQPPLPQGHPYNQQGMSSQGGHHAGEGKKGGRGGRDPSSMNGSAQQQNVRVIEVGDKGLGIRG